MKRKWWIVGGLVFLELLVCGGIILTLWAGRAVFEGVRLFYVADTHVEETVEETFFVDGPAVLDLEAVSGRSTYGWPRMGTGSPSGWCDQGPSMPLPPPEARGWISRSACPTRPRCSWRPPAATWR